MNSLVVLDVDIQKVDIENLPKDHLKQLEADSYWCMSKLLERIQENYVFSQPGIQKNVKSLEDLIKRIDSKIQILTEGSRAISLLKASFLLVNLYNHLRRNNVEFIQFAFRWMNNLLMREIPLNCTIRLWDTYHVSLRSLRWSVNSLSTDQRLFGQQAEPFGFSDFHLYVCTAFLRRYSKEILAEKDFQVSTSSLQVISNSGIRAKSCHFPF